MHIRISIKGAHELLLSLFERNKRLSFCASPKREAGLSSISNLTKKHKKHTQNPSLKTTNAWISTFFLSFSFQRFSLFHKFSKPFLSNLLLCICFQLPVLMAGRHVLLRLVLRDINGLICSRRTAVKGYNIPGRTLRRNPNSLYEIRSKQRRPSVLWALEETVLEEMALLCSEFQIGMTRDAFFKGGNMVRKEKRNHTNWLRNGKQMVSQFL